MIAHIVTLPTQDAHNLRRFLWLAEEGTPTIEPVGFDSVTVGLTDRQYAFLVTTLADISIVNGTMLQIGGSEYRVTTSDEEWARRRNELNKPAWAQGWV
jgi:hypothetical protein